jgi:DNA-binding SARP family transcriptional activator
LGPLEVANEDGELSLGGGKQRGVLVLLLLHANEQVPTDKLIDQLWVDAPPASAPKIVQNYVSRLRRALGDGALSTHGRSYVLRVAPGELDLDRFKDGLELGRRELAAGDPGSASSSLQRALDLWRGPPLADFTYEPFARAEIEQLEELRLAALIERVEADLALGRHTHLIGELEELVRRHPLQERLRAQLMLALYRSGRQAEALQVYREARQTLAAELGIEPGEALQHLERAILTHDPALEPPQTPPPARPPSTDASVTRRRMTRLLLSGVAVIAAAVTAIVAVTRLAGEAPMKTFGAGTSVGVLDPKTNEFIDRVAISGAPAAIAAGGNAVWAVNGDSGTFTWIDARTDRVKAVLGVPGVPTSIAYGLGGAWIANSDLGTLSKYDRQNEFVEQGIRVEPAYSSDYITLTVGDGAVWAASTHRSAIVKLDPTGNRVLATIRDSEIPVALAAGAKAVWVISITRSGTGASLSRIDPATDKLGTMLSLPSAPTGVAVGFGSVWVIFNSLNTVWRINPRTAALEQTIGVGDGPYAVAAGSGAMWVANAKAMTISRVDPTTDRVDATIPVQGRPVAIASGNGKIWVSS